MDCVDSSLPGGHAPAHWYDTLDRQTSQSLTNAAKGLRNAPGENNCFLNSAVQVFWHIDVFRRSYRRLSGHLCMGHSCIFCALKVIFTQFQYSDQSSLQPSALRKALANTFAKQERFQLGHMDDAAECFENILNRIHYHIANNYNEDACNAPHCVPHQKFAMTVFDQLVCPCGAASEPHKFYEMVHYISANALVSQSRTMQESGDILHPNRFGLLLRNAGAVGDIRDCPGNCGKRVQIRRTLLSVPDVVSIGLVWGSDKADPELAAEVTRTIGTTIMFPDMFHSVMCNDANQLPRLHLTSVVCYYGKHYSTFIFHTKLQEWVYFDDATVRQVGTRWEQVVERIVRSRYQPLLLIYTNPNAQPVPTETAPSTRVMAPGYSMTPAKTLEENKGKPAVPEKMQTGSRSRSLTPSCERTDSNQSAENREKEPLERTSSFEHRRQSSFMIAVTRQKNKEEAIYAVPHNNSKVMNSQKDISQSDARAGYHKQNSGTQLADIPDGPEDPDSYNYTLSNSDQYRRPGMNVSDLNRIPLTQNFSRNNEQQRKDSFKKGKGKLGADVIRYHVDGSRRSSQSSESDCAFPAGETQNGPTVSNSKPALPAKPKSIQHRSQSVDEVQDNVVSGGSHKVVKPLPANGTFEARDSVTRAHTPVQSGLATLPRNKKSSSTINSSVPSASSASSLTSMAQMAHSQGSHTVAANRFYPHETPPPPYSLHSSHTISSGYQNCLTYQNVVENDMHTRQGSNSSILSSGTVVECPVGDSNSHDRQLSTASQDTLTDKHKEQKSKSKKKDKEEKKREKEEKKKDENKHKKEEKKSKSKKDKPAKPSVADKPPVCPDKKPTDEGFSEENYYIDRRMVESVLSAQKLQRSGSCLSQASSSSIESDAFSRNKGTSTKDSLTPEIPFDAASLDSHKDSGYASSDRNSSSSTGSITMNPYEQYFLSRSMIPPKTLNQQALVENMRKLMDNGPGVSGLEYTKEKDLKSIVVNPNEQYYQNQTVGHCQQWVANYQKSGLPNKDFLSLPKEERDQYLMNAISGSSKAGPHANMNQGLVPPPSPTKVTQDQSHTGHTMHMSKSAPVLNGVASQQQALRNSENGCVQNPSVPGQNGQQPLSNTRCPESHQHSHEGGDGEFHTLCHKAEEFMDSCVLAETSEQYRDALGYCQQAIDQLKMAMKMPNIGQSMFNMAQKKSNSCVIKFRSLQKRLMACQESGTSTNSSDSGINQDFRSRNGHFNQQKSQSHLQAQNGKPPSRSSSQNSMDSLGSNRSATPVFDKVMRPATDDRVPPVEPHMPHGYHNAYKDRSFETNYTDSSHNADAYGTLPRWKTQKSQEHVRQCNIQKYEAEVYNDFLENQRRQSGNHSRTSSGARTPVNEIDLIGVQENNSQMQEQYSSVTNSAQCASAASRHFGEPVFGHQSLKSVPVTPPSIENQSQHAEVGNQFKQRTLSVPNREPAWIRSANNQNGYHSNQQTVFGTRNGDFHQSKLVVRPSLESTLPFHVRTGSLGTRTLAGSSSTVCMAYSIPLPAASASLCQPVEIPVMTTLSTGCQEGYRRGMVGRKLDRSASFSHPARPLPNVNLHSETEFYKSKNFTESGLAKCKHSGRSQPDLHKLSQEPVSVPQRPLTPQILCPESQDRPVSVKALTSRFESASVSNDSSTNESRPKSFQNVSDGVHTQSTSQSRPADMQELTRVGSHRQRSKSESEFLAEQPPRPKSVLAKRSKNSDRINKPRKSVTFSENVCLVAAADQWSPVSDDGHTVPAGYQSEKDGYGNQSLYQGQGHKMSEDTDSSSSNSPIEVVGEGACMLCHKKGVEQGQNYCVNCTMYMSRFTPR